MGKRQKQYPKRALIRLTEDEHARLTALSARAGLSFSRFLVEAGLTGKTPSAEDRMLRERALLQLFRVGNNLNQIAKQLNAQSGALSSNQVDNALCALKDAVKRMENLWEHSR